MSSRPVQPGLDRDLLLALSRPRQDPAELVARIRSHLDSHDGYVAFSGGKDSLVVLHLALAAEPAVPVVFFDSGLEFPETYAYLNQLARDWNLTGQLRWIPARPGLLEVLHATGAWDHRRTPGPAPDLHQILIRDPAARAHRAYGPGELWGVRSAESRGRAALHGRALRAEASGCTDACCRPGAPSAARHGGVVRRADGTVAYSPVWRFSDTEVWGYIRRHGLPVNPVYDKLRRLGAPERALRVSPMVDGNALELGRITWLRRGWPGLFEELAQVLPRLREYV